MQKYRLNNPKIIITLGRIILLVSEQGFTKHSHPVHFTLWNIYEYVSHVKTISSNSQTRHAPRIDNSPTWQKPNFPPTQTSIYAIVPETNETFNSLESVLFEQQTRGGIKIIIRTKRETGIDLSLLFPLPPSKFSSGNLRLINPRFNPSPLLNVNQLSIAQYSFIFVWTKYA